MGTKSIKDKVLDSNVGQNILGRQIKRSLEENDQVGVFKVLARNEKFADKYLEMISNSEGFHQIVTEFMKQISEVNKSNDKSSDHLFELFKDTRKGLQTYLDNNSDSLTSEEKKDYLEQIMEIAKMGDKLDADNKTFSLKLAAIIVTPLAIAGSIVLSSLVNSGDKELTYGEDDEED